MKAKFAYLIVAAILPVTAAFAADEVKKDDPKVNPRPAQESRGANATGKESTKPVDKKEKEYAAPANGSTAKPEAAKPLEDAKTQPRPAQESRSGATTGRDATKSPEPAPKASDVKPIEKDKKENK